MLTLQRGWDNAAHTLLVCWVTTERGFPRETSQPHRHRCLILVGPMS